MAPCNICKAQFKTVKGLVNYTVCDSDRCRKKNELGDLKPRLVYSSCPKCGSTALGSSYNTEGNKHYNCTDCRSYF